MVLCVAGLGHRWDSRQVLGARHCCKRGWMGSCRPRHHINTASLLRLLSGLLSPGTHALPRGGGFSFLPAPILPTGQSRCKGLLNPSPAESHSRSLHTAAFPLSAFQCPELPDRTINCAADGEAPGNWNLAAGPKSLAPPLASHGNGWTGAGKKGVTGKAESVRPGTDPSPPNTYIAEWCRLDGG